MQAVCARQFVSTFNQATSLVGEGMSLTRVELQTVAWLRLRSSHPSQPCCFWPLPAALQAGEPGKMKSKAN